MKTFTIHTLGCKTNQYDSEAIAGALEMLGLVRVQSPRDADICIVNTCTVTHIAEGKSRRLLRTAIRARPRARIVLTGCTAHNGIIPDADDNGEIIVVNNEQKPSIPQLLGLTRHPVPFQAGRFHGHTRAFLKVQDGCDCFCSYCIVPFVRGRVKSRPLDEIEREAQLMAAAGHKEIVLTGIHLGSFGKDMRPRRNISDILDRLVRIEGLRRIRLSSIEARDFSDRLLEQVARYDPICPHFHIPLQSGSDRILEKMRRRYRRTDIFDLAERIGRIIPEPSFTTDVIVGFPGETEEDFSDTLEVVERIGFARVHIFPYSDREGTAASRMPAKVDPRVIKNRCKRLRDLCDRLAEEYKARFLGRKVLVLTENTRDPETNMLVGFTDRYIRVFFDGDDSQKNQFVQVMVTDVAPHFAHGVRTCAETSRAMQSAK